MFGGFGPNFDRKQLRAAKRFPCGVLAHSDSRAPRGERWMGQVIGWAKGACKGPFRVGELAVAASSSSSWSSSSLGCTKLKL